MLSAALPKLTHCGPKVEGFAKVQFLKIIQRIQLIEEQFAAGAMDEADAKAALEMQIEVSKDVLITVEGLSLIAIEQAINAALGVISTTVNTVLNFTLIP